MIVDYKPGDVLLTANSSFFGKAIRKVQGLLEPGDKANFSHAAIITDELGNLVESVATISENNISKYKGVECLLARHEDMAPDAELLGYSEIVNNIGQIYPFHRLLFIAFGLSKIHLDWPVCSELVSQYLMGAGIDMGLMFRGKRWRGGWAGVTPDMIEDAIYRGGKWKIIAQGQFITN